MVDADQRDVEWRKRARDVEHGAVAAKHDRQVRLTADVLERQHPIAAVADVGRGQPVDQHLDPAAFEITGEFQQRPGNFRAIVFADQADGLERRFHGLIICECRTRFRPNLRTLSPRPAYLCRINRCLEIRPRLTNARKRCSKRWSSATSPTASRSVRARCRGYRASTSRPRASAM